jgi:UDP-N-acetylglucosamine 2-epimerase
LVLGDGPFVPLAVKERECCKISPLMREMQRHPEIERILVHTDQHYDEMLSDIFFHQMGIPAPHVNLEVGSRSHAAQIAEILKRIEPVLVVFLKTGPGGWSH